MSRFGRISSAIQRSPAWSGKWTEGLLRPALLVIVPNFTRGAHPYALIENVVTHAAWRNQGIGSAMLRYTLDLAWKAGCYKAMLLTGRKQEEVLRFYEQAGFKRGEKMGFVAHPEWYG